MSDIPPDEFNELLSNTPVPGLVLGATPEETKVVLYNLILAGFDEPVYARLKFDTGLAAGEPVVVKIVPGIKFAVAPATTNDLEALRQFEAARRRFLPSHAN